MIRKAIIMVLSALASLTLAACGLRPAMLDHESDHFLAIARKVFAADLVRWWHRLVLLGVLSHRYRRSEIGWRRVEILFWAKRGLG